MKHGAVLTLFLLAACSAQGDPPAQLNPSPLGNGLRLRDVQDPSKKACNGAPCAGQTVNVTSVVVTAIDTFDETQNGKSRGTIFLQDADIAGPYGGISLYSPTFVPANLRVAPGDVVDMVGQYTEQTTIGTTVTFPAGTFLPQMSKPQVSPSFETPFPAGVVVSVSDLDSFSPNGRRWIGMLVTIQDVTVVGAPTAKGSGRVAALVTNTANGLQMNNELFDLQAWTGTNTGSSFAPGTHFKSITGIVDFFFNIFICPRSMADLVQ